LNIGSVRICLVKKAAKNTTAQIMTKSSSPANVNNWFITGRAGATVLKIVLMLWIIERKSFLAIQIIKNARTMFIPEIEGVVEMLLTKSCTSKRIPYFEVKPEIQSTIEGETLRSPMQLVRIIIKIGTKEKINPNVHEEAAIPKLF